MGNEQGVIARPFFGSTASLAGGFYLGCVRSFRSCRHQAQNRSNVTLPGLYSQLPPLPAPSAEQVQRDAALKASFSAAGPF
jgi:hypothetical protein